MTGDDVRTLSRRLHEAQAEAARRLRCAGREVPLDAVSPVGLTALEVLRTWGWHFWTHTRDLVRLRGPLPEDSAVFHVDQMVRQACEEFGRFAGEVACLADEDLDRRPPEGGASVRETVEHVIDDLQGFLPETLEKTVERK